MSTADGSSVDIPVQISTDQAKQNLQELLGAAEQLDATLEKLQNKAVQAFNKLNLSMGGQPYRAADYSGVEQFAQQMGPDHIWSLSPRLGQTMAQVEARRQQVGGSVAQYATANPLQVATTAGQPLYQAFSGWTPGGAASTAGQPGQGSGMPFGSGGSGTPQDTDRVASTFADRFAQVLSRTGVNLVSSAASGVLGGAGLGAAGDVLSGLVRPLAAAAGDLLVPLAVGAAAAGIGLAVNGKQSQYFGEERQLAAGVGTQTGAHPADELSTAVHTGWNFYFHEKDSVAAARQLGDAGISSEQVGGALSSSMALARLGSMSLPDATSLTATMMTQGGLSVAQLAEALGKMDQAAKLSGVSIDRIAAGMKEIAQASGGLVDVNGLVAAQHQAGNMFNVPQMLAGAIGQTGTQALQSAAILGMTPQEFTTAQAHPDQLWDRYARLAKQYDRGPYGTDVAEQMLQQAGLDMSSISGPNASRLMTLLTTQGPQAAESFAARLQKQEHKTSPDQLDQLGQKISNDVVPKLDQLGIATERLTYDMIQGAGRLDGPPTPLGHAAQQNQSAQDRLNHATVEQGLRGHGGYGLAQLGYDASGDKQFGPIREDTLLNARSQGLWVGGGPGTGSFINSGDFLALEQAAKKTGVPLSILLEQAKVEATNSKTGAVDDSIISKDGGYGLGQFTDPNVAVKYLGQASKQLGAGTVTAKNWHQYALDPKVASLAMAMYDSSLYQSTNGDWQVALSQYNGGPHPNNAANNYGFAVYGGALAEQQQIGVKVDVTVKDERGKQLEHKTQTTQHTVNTKRKPVGHQTYGPTHHTPPVPPPKKH